MFEKKLKIFEDRKRQMRAVILVLLLLLLLQGLVAVEVVRAAARGGRSAVVSKSIPNILHLVVDDLRPEIRSYGGNEHIRTPNIDRLARSGVSFDRAYAQIAVCGPSRNSFLTGRRPDASRSWNFINHFRQDHPEWTSLPGMFVKSGRNSFGTGKMYHPFLPPRDDGNKS